MLRFDLARLGVLLTTAAAVPAPAGSLTDTGDAGATFLVRSDNVAIYDGKFEVQFHTYDGNGATPEDGHADGSFVYDADIPVTGIPAGEVFTRVELDLLTWNGREEHDGQAPGDIYRVEVSDDGEAFTPVALAFTGPFPDPDAADGLTRHGASADGFAARYVRVGITARVEGSGAGDNNPWSSQVREVRLITAASEPRATPRREPVPPPLDVEEVLSAEDAEHRRYGPWFSSRLGGGGYWVDTRPSAVAGRWYLWSDVGGFYRSDDDTKTWRSLHQNLPDGQGDVTNIRALVEHPVNAERLVVLTGTRWRDVGGVWASDDGGRTWDKTLTALFWGNADGREFGRTLRIDPGDADTLLAAGQGGVWRSEDFGRTWRKTAAPDGLNPVDLGCDPGDPSRWWLSSWAIDTWTQGNAFTTGDGFYVSDDRGETWAKIGHEAPREVVVDPTVPGRWIGAFRGEVRESRDGGRSWSALSDGLPRSDSGAAVNIGPAQVQAMTTTHDAVLVANAAGELFRLPGGGSRWQPIERRRVSAPAWWFGNTGYATHAAAGGEGGWVHYGKSAASLSVDPRDPDRWVMTDWYAVWRTEDAGRTWRYAGDGAENTVLHGAAVDPGDPDHVLVFMGDNGVLHSRDRGRTLRKLPMPGAPLYSNVKQAVFAPSDDRVVWAIGNTKPGQWESSTVARSTDAGRTWRYTATAGLPAGLAQRHFINAIATDPADARRAWVAVSGPVGSGGGVYATRDSGRSWSAINDGLPAGADLFTANIWDAGPELAVDGEGVMLAVSKSDRSVHRYDPANDRWSAMGQAPGRPDAVAADPHTPGRWWLACGDAGLFVYESEPGAGWSRVFDRGASSLAIDPTRPGRMALGALDGVHLSDDHGRTWRRADARMPHRYFPVVAIGHDLIVAGTKGNGVFVAPWH